MGKMFRSAKGLSERVAAQRRATPLWNSLDLTPAGRGTDWYPKLA